MNHQPHIFLVHAHTKGIGGSNHPGMALDKVFLNMSFLGGILTGMKSFYTPVLLL